MIARVKVLRQLVAESQYVVDPHAVAEAIVVRRLALRLLPDLALRCAPAPAVARVRSFRPHRGARSFRLVRDERRHAHRLTRAPDGSPAG